MRHNWEQDRQNPGLMEQVVKKHINETSMSHGAKCEGQIQTEEQARGVVEAPLSEEVILFYQDL